MIQVAYYHNPDYQRQKQLPLKDVQLGKFDINTLPSLLQIYPTIRLLYDDDDIHGKMMTWMEEDKRKQPNELPRYMWAWILTSGRRIYLMRWSTVTHRHTVFYNAKQPNILSLLQQFFLQADKNTEIHSSNHHLQHPNNHHHQHPNHHPLKRSKNSHIAHPLSQKTRIINPVTAYFQAKFASKTSTSSSSASSSAANTTK